MSTTVTVEVHVELFPLPSFTVSVTVFAPRFTQVNAEVLMLRLAVPQLSELPLSTSAAVIVALPDPSNITVMFWQEAVGEVVSATVTVEVQVLLFPLPSSTVNVTVFAPRSAQVNDEVLMLRLAVPQLSELPLSTSAAVIVALPDPSNITVMF